MLKRWIATSILMLGIAATAAAADVPGSQDHPVLTRYPASEIRWYDVQAFEPYSIAIGPVTGYRAIDEWTEIAGRTTRIYYELQGFNTHTEVFANYRKALTEAGFTVVAEGVFAKSSQSSEIGSRKWLGVHYSRNEIAPNGIRLLHGSSTSAGSAFVAASKESAASTVFVVLGMTQYAQDLVATLIDVIEIQSVETDLVTVDADAMGGELDEYGRVTLDGLFFDHDKATLTAASQPALEEIAKFLRAHPDLRFYVVGHTDGTGSLAYNQKLSRQRAEAVVAALEADHGIARQRLESHGVGPLVPVFSNSSDRGRARNRRVELVERR